MKSLISIVIPHKDGSNTLRRLVETIPDSPEIEIIVVDDKSDVDEINCILMLAKIRSNLSIFFNDSSESNAGVARNIGLDHCEGEWVIFADSDDEFLNGAFEIILKAISRYDGDDVILFECSSLNENREPSTRADKVNYLIANFPINIETILYEWLVPWGKLIKLNLIRIHKLRFDSCLASNDVMFSTRLAAITKNISVVNESVYCCFTRDGSLMSNLDEHKSLSRLKVLTQRNIYLASMGVKLRRDRGFKYFLYSNPIKVSRKKIRIYFAWLLQFIFRG